MSCSEYDALRSRAAGHCEACGVPAEEAGIGRLIIDHDHRYGRGAVRGLICSKCNTGLSTLEHSAPVAQSHYSRGYSEYIRKAWFVQVAAWARTCRPSFNDDPEQLSILNERVLRSSFVAPMTRVMRQQPELRIHSVVTPGPIRHRIHVRHVHADFTSLECTTVLLLSNVKTFEVERITARHFNVSRDFDRIGVAAGYVREVGEYWASQAEQNRERRAQLAAEWEARRDAPPVKVERAVREKLQGKRFGAREVQEVTGCSYPMAGQALRFLVKQGALREDGRGPRAHGRGSAPKMYVFAKPAAE